MKFSSRKPIGLHSYNDTLLRQVSTHLQEVEDEWIVIIHAYVHTTLGVKRFAREVKVEGILDVEGSLLTSSAMPVEVDRDKLQQNLMIVKARMRVKKVSELESLFSNKDKGTWVSKYNTRCFKSVVHFKVKYVEN